MVAVSIPKDKQEQILKAAKNHQLSLAQFLLQSSLHYLNQSFLLPNPERVSHLRQLLSLWHSDLSRLISQATDEDMIYTIKLIQQRVSMLENQVHDLFTKPVPVPQPAYDH